MTAPTRVPTLPPPPADVHVVEVEVPGMTVPEALCRYAHEQRVDLIVMGTHGRRGVAHFALGSLAEEVVREAPCPVLTVRRTASPDASRSAGPPAARRLLVPVDFSERSEVALRHAVALAEALGGRVDLLHAVDLPALPTFYGVTTLASLPDLVTHSRAALRKIVRRLLPEGVRGDVLVETDAPAAAILAAVQQRRPDLVVMATHGLRGLKRLALGSVAERVVQRAPCPVLTVKSFGRSLLTEPQPQEAAVGA